MSACEHAASYGGAPQSVYRVLVDDGARRRAGGQKTRVRYHDGVPSRPALLIAAAAVALASAAPVQQPASRRVVLVSFDGVADWIVDRLIDEGKAPALAALAREGARAEAMVSVIPTLTAVAHATLWTGAWPRDHGVVGNSMPRAPAPNHTLLDLRSGFSSEVLRAEPIWVTAARHGRQVLVAQATGGYPFARPSLDRLTQFDAYGERLLPAELIDVRLDNEPYAFRIGDTPAELRRHENGVLVRVGGRQALLSGTDRRLSPAFPVHVKTQAGYVRALVLDHDLSSGRVLLSRGEVRAIASTDSELVDDLVAEAGVPLGEVHVGSYRRGRFGPTLAEGGDGRAERMLSDAVLANHEYFEGLIRFAASRSWDLLVLYVSSMDTAGHALVGMLDETMPGHDPARAARAWPVYEHLFRRSVDDYVAELRRRFPDAVLIVVADHGLEGTQRVWYPNAVLREAGLLVEERGRPDLSRTKALFLSSHDTGIYLNADRRAQGIVADADRVAVQKEIVRALLSARDPRDGTPLVRSVIDPAIDGEALGIGGATAPDVYFDPAPGYETHADFGASAIASDGPVMGAGSHGPFPTRRRLHAIFYAAGPGVSPGTRLGVVRAIDVAPTAARLLGIPPPPQSAGRPLLEP